MNLFKTLFLSVILLFATFAHAVTSKFEVEISTSSTSLIFPMLELNDIENIALTVSRRPPPFSGYSIDRMELIFPNAKNLVVNNFKEEPGPVGDTFCAIVNSRWVFRRLAVNLILPSQKPASDKPIEVRVYVMDMDSFNNDFCLPPEDQLLVAASGILFDVTPSPVADIQRLNMESKRLVMKLYQRPADEMRPPQPGSGFKIAMSWMGHGERNVYLPTPFVPEEYDRFKATALNLVAVPGQEDAYTVEIEYEDETGYKQVLQAGDLQTILDQVYAP